MGVFSLAMLPAGSGGGVTSVSVPFVGTSSDSGGKSSKPCRKNFGLGTIVKPRDGTDDPVGKAVVAFWTLALLCSTRLRIGETGEGSGGPGDESVGGGRAFASGGSLAL
jgi:hypothetical protein